MSAPPAVADGARPRTTKRGGSAERVLAASAGLTGGGDSPALSSSRASLGSNRDSGYVPSPAGAVRFDWDCGDECELATPAAARRRAVTRPIAIPGGGLQTPDDSQLLRRRRRQWRTLSAGSSDGDWEASGDGPAAGDEPDHQRRERPQELGLTPTEDLLPQAPWGVSARPLRPDSPDVRGAPSRRPMAPRRGTLSATASVEQDVGQELREIADSLPLSRSAPGDLQPRRDIWTMLQRTLSFRLGREVPAPQRRRPENR